MKKQVAITFVLLLIVVISMACTPDYTDELNAINYAFSKHREDLGVRDDEAEAFWNEAETFDEVEAFYAATDAMLVDKYNALTKLTGDLKAIQTGVEPDKYDKAMTSLQKGKEAIEEWQDVLEESKNDLKFRVVAKMFYHQVDIMDVLVDEEDYETKDVETFLAALETQRSMLITLNGKVDQSDYDELMDYLTRVWM